MCVLDTNADYLFKDLFIWKSLQKEVKSILPQDVFTFDSKQCMCWLDV